jgi:transcriptional regulator with XRE-family HTH domain
MSKSVLDTIREYKESSPEVKQKIETHELELELCERMVELREDAGFTQAELAERLGFTQGYVAKLENGAYDRCGVGTLRTFALALGYDLDLKHLFEPIEGYQWRNVIKTATLVANHRESTSSATMEQAFVSLQACDSASLNKLAA